LLFLESPVGVGFSYTNTSSDLTKLDDAFVAEDAYNFLVNWFKRFPQYKGREFYISGESYAGHYVPQLAELVHDRNKDKDSPYINLKGFMVGNPLTDDYYDSKGLAEYAWSHAVVSDEIYERIKKVCDFRLSNWSDDCDKAMSTVFSQYHEIDIYNIYAPRCNLPQSSAALAVDRALTANDQEHFRRRIRMFSGYDPCYSSYAERYFNKEDVQRAFHANVSGTRKWQVCSDSILRSYNFSVLSILPIYSKLIKAGLRVWLYSGDADGRVPVIGSRYCVEALGLPIKTKWQPWYMNKQVAGRFVEYHGMTMVTIRGAGHLVPLNKPEEGLALIDTFLLGKQLPTHR
jgi:serine carboxypeptidase-like clade 2